MDINGFIFSVISICISRRWSVTENTETIWQEEKDEKFTDSRAFPKTFPKPHCVISSSVYSTTSSPTLCLQDINRVHPSLESDPSDCDNLSNRHFEIRDARTEWSCIHKKCMQISCRCILSSSVESSLWTLFVPSRDQRSDRGYKESSVEM